MGQLTGWLANTGLTVHGDDDDDDAILMENCSLYKREISALLAAEATMFILSLHPKSCPDRQINKQTNKQTSQRTETTFTG